jgi:hypothetical protein
VAAVGSSPVGIAHAGDPPCRFDHTLRRLPARKPHGNDVLVSALVFRGHADGAHRDPEALERLPEVGQPELLSTLHQKVAAETTQAIENGAFHGLEREQCEQCHRERHDGCGIEAETYGRTDCRGDPQGGGRGEASDAEALLEDGAGTEEADAGDDLRGDPGGIDSYPRVSLGQVESEGADEREQGSAQRHEDVRSQSGGLIGQLALEAERAPERRGEQYPYGEVVGANVPSPPHTLGVPISMGWPLREPDPG